MYKRQPEDTKAGMIQAYLDRFTGGAVCSKQLYKEALNHAFDEPKQWEIREVNDIMNHCITGWKYFTNPRIFEGYGRQKGWERDAPATEDGNEGQKNRRQTPDGFEPVTGQMAVSYTHLDVYKRQTTSASGPAETWRWPAPTRSPPRNGVTPSAPCPL